MKILVTGVTGQLGREMVLAISELDYPIPHWRVALHTMLQELNGMNAQ